MTKQFYKFCGVYLYKKSTSTHFLLNDVNGFEWIDINGI